MIVKQKYSDEDLINQIKEYFKRHSIVPIAPIRNAKENGFAGSRIFLQRFGTWNNALTLAGFPLNATVIGKVNHTCSNCQKQFIRNAGESSNSIKSNRRFCSKSCAATYNNTHKTHGYRKSKLEKYVEEILKREYPNLEIHFNRKDTINSELDIYIPLFKLAFELNGIFHYEPIYSNKQFNQIQNNDKRKFQACLERGIELCIIDTSQLSYFKPDKAEKYYQIIKQIIDNKMVVDTGIEPV